MKESTTYQYILAEGRAEGRAEGAVGEARKILLRLGQRRFGPLTEEDVGALEAVSDLDRLERMTDRILEAATWQELLDTP